MEVLVDQKFSSHVGRASVFLNEKLPRGSVFTACVIGFLSVSLLWGFWTMGYYALGINATLISLMVIAFIVAYGLSNHNNILLRVVPLVLISLSFFLYENPFIKCINIIVFPVILCFFFWISVVDSAGKLRWSFLLIEGALMSLNFYLTACIPNSFKLLLRSALNPLQLNPKTVFSVLKGVIPLALLYLIVIPMLTYADGLFGAKLNYLLSYLDIFFNLSHIFKVATCVLFVTYLIALMPTLDYAGAVAVSEPKEKPQSDSISTFIVLTGMLVLYCIFLFVQLERILVNVLPFDFLETEYYVKTGFWQLFFVSLLNLILSYFFYGRTSSKIRQLLCLFNIASFLMLSSSAQRLGLYVYYYGFSYEKFYACYTVLYCGVLLLILTYVSMFSDRKDPIKYGVYVLFYMYAFVTVLPVEPIIFKSNVYLSTLVDSRIDLEEMRMLSVDVYSLVDSQLSDEYGRWADWKGDQELRHNNKQIYEMTLSDFINRNELMDSQYDL